MSADIIAGDVISAPEITSWIAAARDKGCPTVLGVDMFAAVRELLLEESGG